MLSDNSLISEQHRSNGIKQNKKAKFREVGVTFQTRAWYDLTLFTTTFAIQQDWIRYTSATKKIMEELKHPLRS